MKTNEQRHEEVSELLSVGKEVFGALREAFTGENTCPDCGAPIYQVGEKDMTCPNCGTTVHFQGTTAYTDRELAEVDKRENSVVQAERLRRLGRTRVELINILRKIGGICAWLPFRLADWLESGQSFYNVREELADSHPEVLGIVRRVCD